MPTPWLQRLPQSRRAASGLEWRLWRKLPAIALAGTLIPLVVVGVLHFLVEGAGNASQLRWLQVVDYCMLGAVIFHWSMILTVAIGCAVVMVMKGPGFVADGYRVPHADQPRKTLETPAEAAHYRVTPR